VPQAGQEPEIGEKGSQTYVEAGIRHPSATQRLGRTRSIVTLETAGTRAGIWRSLVRRAEDLWSFAVEGRSLHFRPMRCDHRRRAFGLIIHRYWRMRFCSADCLTAYQRRLDQETIAKIRWLDFVGTTNKAGVRG
jgi:hypothetical protein